MSESDRHAALLALALVLRACGDALCSSDRAPDDSGPVDVALVRRDLLALLAFLHHATTKLSLALKPSSPTYSASLAPLNEVAARVTAISQSIRLFRPRHGRTLANEASSLVAEIVESVRSLAQTLLDIGDHAGDDYLVRTAAVHDLIDKARSPDGLSTDNVTAIRKLWLRDQASLDDGYEELAQMIENVGQEIDDGWDEIGLTTEALSPSEAERAKKAQTLLRMSTLLHKRVGRDLLFVSYPIELNPQLDLLPQCSSALLVASDDLVAGMYSPQNTQNLAAVLASFKNAIQNLQSPITPLLQDKTKSWFSTCFEQIFKAVNALSSMIDTDEQ